MFARRFFRTALLSGFCLALLGCHGSPPQTTPPPDPDVFPGLTADVEIRIDHLGIPHVYGQTQADAYYGAGYQMAKDRLFEMDWMRRRALGTQAEVYGESKLDQDKLTRLLDFPRWGRADAERMRLEDPDDYRLVVAWVAGVNQRIEEVRSGAAPLPYGFGPGELDYMPEPWQPTDPLTILKVILFANQSQIEKELLASIVRKNMPDLLDEVQLLKPMYPAYIEPPDERPATTSGPAPAIGPQLATPALRPDAISSIRHLRSVMSAFDLGGSNNWAVSGRFTDNGRPIIAGDPHQELTSPSLMYAQHVSSADGALDAAGFSFIGVPGVHLGQNAHCVWTATNNFPDTMDIWEVSMPDASHIMLGGDTLPVTTRSESIVVKGRADPVVLQARDVEGHGVLLDDEVVLPADLVAMRSGSQLLFDWVGFAATPEATALLRLNRATNLDELERDAKLSDIAAFNFVAADQTGIDYMAHVAVPDRSGHGSSPLPWVVVDGNDPNTLWTGAMLPDAMLPHSRNPAQGYLVTANNDPFGFTDDGSVADDPWYYGSFYAAGFRAERIDSELSRLTTRGNVTVQDMETLQNDVHSKLADELLPMLQDTWSRVPTDDTLSAFRGHPELQTLVDIMTGWDRNMARAEKGAVPFHMFIHFLTQRTIGDDLGLLFDQVLNANAAYAIKMAVLALEGQYPNGDMVLQGGKDVIILNALSDTAAELMSRYGAVDADYTWGDVHGTSFDNAYGGDLTYGFVPTDGGEDTVDPSSSSFFDGNDVSARFTSHEGPIFRLVGSFDADGMPRLVVSFPIGNSGDPSSPHFSDRLDDWVEGRYQPLPFRRADVEAATESTSTLPAQ